MHPHLSCAPAGTRARFLPLLLLADESEQQVRSYIDSGDLYVYAPESETIAGIVLAIQRDDEVVELKAVAVEPAKQGKGIGKRMLAAVLAELQQRGYRQVVVGTANAGIAELAYYQKAGFRLSSIERDFFSPARGYPSAMVENGIRLRDMVWMEMTFAL